MTVLICIITSKMYSGKIKKVYYILFSWFFGKVSRADAEKTLLQADKQTGTYFIRDSNSQPGNYALSIRNGDSVRHYLIKRKEIG